MQHIALVIYWLADGFQEPGIDPFVVDISQNGHEFVAAEAGNHIMSSDTRKQSIGDRFQYRVADGMAMQVVDVLEAIEINKAHRHQALALIGFKQFLFKQFGHPAPIRQAGECVVIGGLFEMLLVFPLLLVQALSLDQVAHSLHQRFQFLGQSGGVTAQAIGQANQTDLPIPGKDRYTDVSRDVGVAFWQAFRSAV